jgi:quinol monooxygenase YgiN
MAIVIVATVVPVPEYQDEVIAVHEKAQETVYATEDGCLLYVLHEGTDGRLVMIEKFSDQAAFDAHLPGAGLAALRGDRGQARGAAGPPCPDAAPSRVGGEGRALVRSTARGSEKTMANKWFETVAVAQRRAKRRLPKSVYGALIAGAEAGVTIRDNVEDFSELGFAPHVAGLPASREMATAPTVVEGRRLAAVAVGWAVHEKLTS